MEVVFFFLKMNGLIFVFVHLNNYFRLHVCLYVRTSHLHFFAIPAVVSQNVTNESCLACVKSEKYVVWVTLRPLGSMRQGEAELRTLQY